MVPEIPLSLFSGPYTSCCCGRDACFLNAPKSVPHLQPLWHFLFLLSTCHTLWPLGQMSLECLLWPKEHARRVGEHMSSLHRVLPHSLQRESCRDQWSNEQIDEGGLANSRIWVWILDPLLVHHVTWYKWWSHLESQFPREQNREMIYSLMIYSLLIYSLMIYSLLDAERS